MRKRVVYLQDNMINDNEMVIFSADIPYVTEGNLIVNEDNLAIPIHDIWVDFNVVYEYNL